MEEKTKIELGAMDGAIVFTPDGVQLLIPEMDDDALLPHHLLPMMALAIKLDDTDFIDREIEALEAKAKEA